MVTLEENLMLTNLDRAHAGADSCRTLSHLKTINTHLLPNIGLLCMVTLEENLMLTNLDRAHAGADSCRTLSDNNASLYLFKGAHYSFICIIKYS